MNTGPAIGRRPITAGIAGLTAIGSKKEKDGFGFRGIGIN